MADRGVLVTGGAQGIGGAVSRAFLAKGDLVVILDRNTAPAAPLREDYGERVVLIEGDVRDEAVLATAVGRTLDLAGSLDVAVNNAGVAGPHKRVADFSDDDYDYIMSVNVRAMFQALRQEIPVMERAGRGAIINMASAIGLVGAANQAVYSASKHAVIGLTRSAALDTAGSGVRVNCVCPGVIESPLSLTAQEENPNLAEIWNSLHPAGRLGRPEEVAAAVAWLADPSSAFVTGVALSVDGGYTTQ